MLFNTLRTSVLRPVVRSAGKRSFSTGDSFYERNQAAIMGGGAIVSLGLIVAMMPADKSSPAPDAGSSQDTMNSQPKQTPPPNYGK